MADAPDAPDVAAAEGPSPDAAVAEGPSPDAAVAEGPSPDVAAAERSPSHSTPSALLALLALAVVPWSVQTFSPGDVTFLFPWGLLNTSPIHVTTLPDFLFRLTTGLPGFILAWPLGVCCWLGAVASAAAGVRWGTEDPRVTAGLLVLAGVTQLSVASGFSVQPNRTAYPTGTLALWVVAWWVYGPRVRTRFRRR